MFSKIRTVVPFALTIAVTLGGATAFAAPEQEGQTHAAHAHHVRGAHGPSLFVRASQLPSLSNAQRSQIQDMIREDQAQRDAMKTSRERVIGSIAGQVEKGSIDRAALAPVLKSDVDVRVNARVKEQALRGQLHTLLTAAQVSELSHGKDFARAPKSEADIRAKIEKRDDKRIERLEKKLGTMSPEARTKLAEHLRKHAR